MIRELSARVLRAPVTEPLGLGRRRGAVIFQPGNLPAAGTGAQAPDHEELVVPKSLKKFEVFLFCLPQSERPLLFSGPSFQSVYSVVYAFTQKERNQHT